MTKDDRVCLRSNTPTMNRLSRVSLSAATIACLVSTMLVWAGGPAQAIGIGSGRAVIHVDAPNAKVTKQADGSYELALPANSTGQWMGERTNAAGKKKVRVGDLTAERLSTGWSNFKYTAAGTQATLVWNADSSKLRTAAVRVNQPRITDAGVVFNVTSDTALPKSLKNMSLHLTRAPEKSVRTSTNPYSQSTAITGSLSISLVANTVTSATPRIYNAGNDSTCWQSTVNTNTRTVGVKNNTCDNIAYANASGLTGSYPYGVSAQFTSRNCSAYFSLNITPPGQATYTYSHTFQWTVSN